MCFCFQLVTLNNHIERSSGESRIKMQHLEGDTNTQVSMIDAKTRQLIDEIKSSVATSANQQDIEREKLEQKLLAMVDKAEGNAELNAVSDFFRSYMQ